MNTVGNNMNYKINVTFSKPKLTIPMILKEEKDYIEKMVKQYPTSSFFTGVSLDFDDGTSSAVDDKDVIIWFIIKKNTKETKELQSEINKISDDVFKLIVDQDFSYYPFIRFKEEK